MNRLPKIINSENHNRHWQQHPQRQRRRQPDHEEKRHHGRRNRRRRVHDSGTEHHPHRVQIIRRPGHQIARAITHVEFRIELHEPVEQIVSQIEFNLARHADQNPPRPEGKNSLHHHRDNDRQAIEAQRVPVQRRIEFKHRPQHGPRSARQSGERPRESVQAIGDDALNQLRKRRNDTHQQVKNQAERHHALVTAHIGQQRF